MKNLFFLCWLGMAIGFSGPVFSSHIFNRLSYEEIYGVAPNNDEIEALFKLLSNPTIEEIMEWKKDELNEYIDKKQNANSNEPILHRWQSEMFLGRMIGYYYSVFALKKMPRKDAGITSWLKFCDGVLLSMTAYNDLANVFYEKNGEFFAIEPSKIRSPLEETALGIFAVIYTLLHKEAHYFEKTSNKTKIKEKHEKIANKLLSDPHLYIFNSPMQGLCRNINNVELDPKQINDFVNKLIAEKQKHYPKFKDEDKIRKKLNKHILVNINFIKFLQLISKNADYFEYYFNFGYSLKFGRYCIETTKQDNYVFKNLTREKGPFVSSENLDNFFWLITSMMREFNREHARAYLGGWFYILKNHILEAISQYIKNNEYEPVRQVYYGDIRCVEHDPKSKRKILPYERLLPGTIYGPTGHK